MIGLLAVLPPMAATGAAPAGPALSDPFRATAADGSGRRPLRSPEARFVPDLGQVPQGDVQADWQALGPYGGDVADVAASPTTPGVLLAGIASAAGGGTLYRSTDDAASWSRVAALAGLGVHDVEFGSGGAVFVATDSGVWSSSDDGANWTRRDLGIGPNQQVLDVALDPGNAAVIWAAVADAQGLQGANVVKSTDGGATWSDVTPPHAPMSGYAIAVDPADPDTVAAVFGGAFGGGEAWVSQDGGASWTDRSAGLPGNPVRAVEFAGSRLLVGGGQLFGSAYLGLYGSDDLGANWTRLDDAGWPLAVVTAIAVDPADPQTILVSTDGAGVNRSADGGATWETAIGGTQQLSAQSLRFAPASSAQLLLGASSLGVYRSSDGGDAFASASTGISEFNLYAIDTSPADANQLAVAFQSNNAGGLLTSSDGGVTWTAATAPATRYSAVRFAPDGTLYALSTGPSTVAPEGLYRRESDGSWTSLGPDQGDLYESDLYGIGFSTDDADLILLGGGDFGVAGWASTVWRSADRGATWEKRYMGADNDKVVDLQFVPGSAGAQIVGAYDGFDSAQAGGAVRSTDGGLNWEPALNGLPAFARLGRLCASAATPGEVYLSMYDSWSSGAVYTSGDAGGSWTSTGWAGMPVRDIACDQDTAQGLYIALEGDVRVQHSGDGGATFVRFSAGLDAAGMPAELAPSKTGAPLLYYAGSQGGFVSVRDGGVTDRVFADGFD
ncbi:WD40/YVTN/BNR-like repeat-containing protein [Dokdonella ginsengisoli]|uniref:WD40/YVTN/BNR-like repeat-containing protein n=1 Tax=Dokdonella ginsengisoli TaxID=363846 RepID=A0ABV9QU63_9GAMM